MQLDRENQQGSDRDFCVCLILDVYLKTFRNNGPFHSTKNSGLNSEIFVCQMERYFPPGRIDLVLFPLEHISHQQLRNKMLKDRDEVAVLSAVRCFTKRSLTRIQNSTLP